MFSKVVEFVVGFCGRCAPSPDCVLDLVNWCFAFLVIGGVLGISVGGWLIALWRSRSVYMVPYICTS